MSSRASKRVSNTGAKRAWEFLKRNLDYIVDWWTLAAGRPPAQGEPFPVHRRTAADEAAAGWGLLAWEDPLAEHGPASPFWTVAPTLEALPSRGNRFFLELLETPGVRLSGVLIDPGPMIVKVEKGDAAVQLLIADGSSFDAGGAYSLSLPGALGMDVRLRRAADLWPLGASKAKSRARGYRTGSSCLRWTGRGRAGRSARSAWRFGRNRVFRGSGRTANCARWRGGE